MRIPPVHLAVIVAELRDVLKDPDSIISDRSRRRLNAIIEASIGTAKEVYGADEDDLAELAKKQRAGQWNDRYDQGEDRHDH